MKKWFVGLLARILPAWGAVSIRSLKEQLAAATAEARRHQDNYLTLVDEHADLRVSYEKLAFERLQAWGLDRADGGEHPREDKGLPGHRRRSAPTAGDR